MFRAGVFCGWVGFGYGNLGDLTIYELCRKRFSTIHWSPIAAFDYTPRPGQFLRRSSRDSRQVIRMLSEELSHQRRLRSLTAKAIHRLARFLGGEVGICGGEMFINRNFNSIRGYTELRKRTGSPIPVFGTGVAEPDFWLGREDGWIDRRKEWVAILEELPTVGVRPRDVEACVDVARRAELPQSAVSPRCFSHEAFLSRVENLDLLVAMNLHAGILAAVANVPFVSLEYQPKCRDFAATIGWEEFLVRTDDLEPGKLIDRVSAVMVQLEAKRGELCRRMCEQMNAFESYCRDIEPLLAGPG